MLKFGVTTLMRKISEPTSSTSCNGSQCNVFVCPRKVVAAAVEKAGGVGLPREILGRIPRRPSDAQRLSRCIWVCGRKVMSIGGILLPVHRNVRKNNRLTHRLGF